MLRAASAVLAPTAAQAATAPVQSLSRSVAADTLQPLVPIGPCSEQNSGVRVWRSGLAWYFQNCNYYMINIAPKLANVYYEACQALAPGATRASWGTLFVSGVAELKYC